MTKKSEKNNSWFSGAWRTTDPTPPKIAEPTQFYLTIQQIGSAEPTIYIVSEAQLAEFFQQFNKSWESNYPIALMFGEDGGMYHPRTINMTWERIKDAS